MVLLLLPVYLAIKSRIIFIRALIEEFSFARILSHDPRLSGPIDRAQLHLRYQEIPALQIFPLPFAPIFQANRPRSPLQTVLVARLLAAAFLYPDTTPAWYR